MTEWINGYNGVEWWRTTVQELADQFEAGRIGKSLLDGEGGEI